MPATNTFNIPATSSLSIDITMATPKKAINLMRGWPSPNLLPAGLLSRAATKLLSNPEVYTPALQYGPDEGYLPLRKGMASWLGRHFGVAPDHERIVITGGASQNIANIMISYADPRVTKGVWVVSPGYHLVCPIFEDAGFRGRLRAAPEDEEGLDVEALGSRLRDADREEGDLDAEEVGVPPGRKLYRHVIYVVSTSSNPSGKTMPYQRRKDLVELARRHNALIISDDVYDFLQWSTKEAEALSWKKEMKIPRVCDIDRDLGYADQEGFGNAISNGSFSKIAGPGVRTGWCEGSKVFAHGLSSQGSTKSGGAPSHFSAAIVSELVQSGELEKFIEEQIRPELRDRHMAVVKAIHQYLPSDVRLRESGVKGEDVYGGFFVWFSVPGLGVPTSIVAQAAQKEEQLVIASGQIFETHGDNDGPTFEEEIRLCFAWEPVEDLVEGVKRLGGLMEKVKQHPEEYRRLYGQAGFDVNANK